QGILAPWGESRVGRKILDVDTCSAPDGCSAWTASAFRVGPAYVGGCEIPIFDPSPGDRTHGLGFIVLGISDPSHAVAGLIANDAADVVEQCLLVHRPQEGLVAVADGSQFAIQAALRL